MSATIDVPTSAELAARLEAPDEPCWWVAPIRIDGTEVDGERKAVRFRLDDRGRTRANAHAVRWEARERWGRVGAFGAWRSQVGGERASIAAFRPVVPMDAGDTLTVEPGCLRMPAEDLDR